MSAKPKIPNGVSVSGVVSVDEWCDLATELYEWLLNMEVLTSVRLIDDWLEHDGLVFPKQELAAAEFVSCLSKFELLSTMVSEDDLVAAGFLDFNDQWYLRVRASGVQSSVVVGLIITEELAKSAGGLWNDSNLRCEESDAYLSRVVARS